MHSVELFQIRHKIEPARGDNLVERLDSLAPKSKFR